MTRARKIPRGGHTVLAPWTTADGAIAKAADGTTAGKRRRLRAIAAVFTSDDGPPTGYVEIQRDDHPEDGGEPLPSDWWAAFLVCSAAGRPARGLAMAWSPRLGILAPLAHVDGDVRPDGPIDALDAVAETDGKGLHGWRAVVPRYVAKLAGLIR